MPKLKSFVTQSGFFDLAIAAPSMKAAADAWGLPQNVFQQGFAEQTDDPAIIAATLAHPGIVLKRAVGSKGAFKENADPPTSLPAGTEPRATPPKKKPSKAKLPKSSGKRDDSALVLSFQRAQAKRDAARAKEAAVQKREAAARVRDEERLQKTSDKAQAALDRARETHNNRMKAIERERLAVERKAQAEGERWDKEKKKLEKVVRETG